MGAQDSVLLLIPAHLAAKVLHDVTEAREALVVEHLQPLAAAPPRQQLPNLVQQLRLYIVFSACTLDLLVNWFKTQLCSMWQNCTHALTDCTCTLPPSAAEWEFGSV